MADPSAVDVSGRALELRHLDWHRLFSPRTVVVVGATDTEGSPQRAQWMQVRDRMGARGARVIPVHPTKPEILGTAAFPDVSSVPDAIDLAVILVRDPLPALAECKDLDVGFAIVFSAGFGEVGTAEGREAEARLAELAGGSMRVIGPNTNMNVLEPWPQGLPGRRLGIITQSGYQGRPITQGQVLGIGIEAWATIGNEADVEWADFVDYFTRLADDGTGFADDGTGFADDGTGFADDGTGLADDGTGLPGRVGAIATYVEGFKSGRTLMLAADAAARARVPIVCVKIGRSDEGRKMAQAHTGHLTGVDAVHDAVFHQFGILRVDDLDELIEISGMFCHTDLVPGAGGVAVYAMSGGTASHVADLCGVAGVPVPKFAPATVEALSELVPWYLQKDNPLDSGGAMTARPENRTVLELMLADPNVEMLFAPITGVFPGMSDALAKDLIELHRQGTKPVITCWNSPIRDDPAYRALCEAGVPLFHSFRNAIRGMQALGAYSAFVRTYRSPFERLPRRASAAAAPARKLLASASGTTLDEVASKQVLASYGIPTVSEEVATSPAEAVAAARALGLPVVMKILSGAIAHKSDLDLVAVGVETETAVRRTYQRLLAQAAAVAPRAPIAGVVVQPMVRGAVTEAILGLSHQPPFGPTITYGLGGIFTEVFEDVAFAVPPFTRAQARAMVESTRGAALLRGARGRPPADVGALVDAILGLQKLALELGDEIEELDINPLMVMPQGAGVVAVDALVVAR